MKAIRTKYLGPTDTKGPRIKADDGEGNAITIPYPYEADTDGAHVLAAKALCDKMEWKHPNQYGFIDNIGYHTFSNGSEK